MSTKTVHFFGRPFKIEGVGNDDPYFVGLADHSDTDFANLIRMLLPKDSTALDIGANIGVTSCMMSQHLSSGMVFAFEPSPSVFPILRRNVTGNALENVSIEQLAVGKEKGKLGFVGHSAYGHLVADEGNQNEGETVDVETVDALVRKLGIDRVDFIKIDVEGFEDGVLAGAAETEKKFSPLYYMEFNAFCIAAYRRMNPFDFAQQLFDQYEHVFLVDHNGGLERLRNDPAHLLHTNIVEEGSVSNLLMTNDQDRLQISSKDGFHELTKMQMKLSQLTKEREEIIIDRDHARRYPWKYLRNAVKMRLR